MPAASALCARRAWHAIGQHRPRRCTCAACGILHFGGLGCAAGCGASCAARRAAGRVLDSSPVFPLAQEGQPAALQFTERHLPMGGQRPQQRLILPRRLLRALDGVQGCGTLRAPAPHVLDSFLDRWVEGARARDEATRGGITRHAWRQSSFKHALNISVASAVAPARASGTRRLAVAPASRSRLHALPARASGARGRVTTGAARCCS